MTPLGAADRMHIPPAIFSIGDPQTTTAPVLYDSAACRSKVLEALRETGSSQGGLASRARRGEIKGSKGIDDPYEAPEHPGIVQDAVNDAPKVSAGRKVVPLYQQGFLRNGP